MDLLLILNKLLIQVLSDIEDSNSCNILITFDIYVYCGNIKQRSNLKINQIARK